MSRWTGRIKSLHFALNEVATTISSDRIKLVLSALHTSMLLTTTRDIQTSNLNFSYKLHDSTVLISLFFSELNALYISCEYFRSIRILIKDLIIKYLAHISQDRGEALSALAVMRMRMRCIGKGYQSLMKHRIVQS